jgi:hypothetical protein
MADFGYADYAYLCKVREGAGCHLVIRGSWAAFPFFDFLEGGFRPM